MVDSTAREQGCMRWFFPRDSAVQREASSIGRKISSPQPLAYRAVRSGTLKPVATHFSARRRRFWSARWKGPGLCCFPTMEAVAACACATNRSAAIVCLDRRRCDRQRRLALPTPHAATGSVNWPGTGGADGPFVGCLCAMLFGATTICARGAMRQSAGAHSGTARTARPKGWRLVR